MMDFNWGLNDIVNLRRKKKINKEFGTISREDEILAIRCQRQRKIISIPEGNQFISVMAGEYITTEHINIGDELEEITVDGPVYQLVRNVEEYEDPSNPGSKYYVAWTW